MTDTTQTISTDDKISALTALVETIAKGQKAMTDGLNKFSTAVVETLSGQATAPAAKVAAAPAATGAKRRGRPPKAVSAEPVKPKAATPDEVHAVELVKRAGRITQTELHTALKIDRSLVQARMYGPLERGEVVVRYVKKPGEHRQIVYYRPDWASFKGE